MEKTTENLEKMIFQQQCTIYEQSQQIRSLTAQLNEANILRQLAEEERDRLASRNIFTRIFG